LTLNTIDKFSHCFSLRYSCERKRTISRNHVTVAIKDLAARHGLAKAAKRDIHFMERKEKGGSNLH